MSKSKDSSSEKDVLDYLRNQNRPYSAIDIFNNLHKEHGKTAVVRALEQLAKDGKIVEKTYGKQKVYFADQSEFADVEESELKRMDDKIAELTETLKDATKQLQSKESLLNNLNNSLTTAHLKENLETTKNEIGKMKSKLEALSSNSTLIDAKEKDRIYKENEKYVKEWRKRRRMAMDMIDAILEGYPKGKKALLEETGVETDEDVNVCLPK